MCAFERSEKGMKFNMEKKDWIQELEKKAKKMQIELSNQQLEQFYLYMNLLLEWNGKKIGRAHV